jgi:hypothetical protein
MPRTTPGNLTTTFAQVCEVEFHGALLEGYVYRIYEDANTHAHFAIVLKSEVDKNGLANLKPTYRVDNMGCSCPFGVNQPDAPNPCKHRRVWRELERYLPYLIASYEGKPIQANT